MKIDVIKETPIWSLYEKGRNYLRLQNTYTDTDRNYRMYNGNQWGGAKLGDVEPVQKNFIKPIVKYKLSVIHSNLYAVIFTAQNHENTEFTKEANKICEMLNRYAARVWEKDKMDYKGRKITKDSAVNDEGIMYVDFDQKSQMPVNEVIKKCDIYYGNENDEDIQAQPYILIRKRMPESNAVEFAKMHGLSEEKLNFIIGDNDTFEESGEAAKEEVDNMVTIVYKMYKKDGTVHFSIATRWIDIVEDKDTGLSLYPVAHFNWEEKEGSARGEGEVRYLIPNQIEVNRTEMRRVITVKQQAYPQKIVDSSRITNTSALSTIGGIIKTNGSPIEDIHKVIGTLTPAQMSPDVKQLQEDLIQVTRDLAGAGDSATGQINPETASGRAILAVQQASQSPMTEQKESYKNFIEDIAKIWLEYLIVYSEDGLRLEEVVTDPQSGDEQIQVVNVPQVTLRQLQATVKVDVTPKSTYDRFAQEQTIENMLMQGFLSPQRVGELSIYADLLDDDSVAPKQKIKEAVDLIRKEQQRIAQIRAEAQAMQQQVNQFLMGEPETQAEWLSRGPQQNAPVQSEVDMDNPDDN